MKGKRIVFPEKMMVSLEDFEIDEKIKHSEVLLRTIYSLICPGTELSVLTGTTVLPPYTVKYPQYAGYTAVSEILKVGKTVTGFQEGDIVFTYSSAHSSIVKRDVTRGVLLKVPKKIDLKFIPFARMAAISMTALRISKGELGDFAAIQGLGLIGNMAAQLFSLSGLNVIGIEISKRRLEIARECGITNLINPLTTDLKKKVMELTDGLGCLVSVDAIGNPRLIENICEITAPLGEVILLGSPRGKYETDITPMLNYIHFWPRGCLTFKGAHEWRFPRFQKEGSKHSIERNIKIIFKLMSDNRLKIKPLLTHILPPYRAEEAYYGLLNKKDEYLGVLFDWNA